MQTETLRVKGSELPPDLLKKFSASPDQIFTIKLESENAFSLQMAMRGMEKESVPKYDFSDLKERWQT